MSVAALMLTTESVVGEIPGSDRQAIPESSSGIPDMGDFG